MRRLVRVAVINPYGAGTVYGGPAVFLNRLFEPLAAEHRITVVYGRRGVGDDGFGWAARAVPLMRFGAYGAREQLTWALRAGWWLFCNAREYDVAHLHGAAFFNLLSAVGAVARRRRYVVVALAESSELSARSRIASVPGVSRLRRALVRGASAGFALSGGIAREFREMGLAPRRVVPIFNPVDTAVYTPRVDAADDLRRGLRSIGSVGMVGERKRSILVLDVLAALRRRGWPATAILVGPFESTTYEKRFIARMQELDLVDAVQLTGHTDAVAPIMNADLSVILNPSSQEGMPGALAEAMASGLPAVVTDVGAMGDVVRSAGAGYVVAPDAERIAAAVAELWVDPAVWARHSQDARIFALKNFDGAQIAASYLRAVQANILSAV